MEESDVQREVRREYGVPDGIQLRVDAHEVLAWRTGHDMSVREVAAHPDDLPLAGRSLAGRTPLKSVDSPSGPLVVREYRKGGLLRHVRGRRMHGRWRPLDEFVLHARLRALNVPVVVAVGCVVLRGPLGWRGFLLSEEVSGGVDLEAMLHRAPGAEEADPRQVLRTAGRSVRALHDAGVPHPDLHPKNLLLTPSGLVLVLDLDKARPQPGPLDERARLENLVRLGRAIEKHRLKGIHAGRREALRFLEGYAGSADAARLWLGRIRGRLGRSLGARILWWHLIGEARPWQPPAAGNA